MQVPGGPLKTRIRIEYDDSLLCHAVTVPECLDQRNLSRWPGVVVDRAFSFCDCGKVAERAAGQQVTGLDQGCPVEFAGGHGQGKRVLRPAVLSKKQTATEPARATGVSGH